MRAGQVLSGPVPPAMQGGYARLPIGRELVAYRLNHLGEGHGLDALGDEGGQLRVSLDLRGAPRTMRANVIGPGARYGHNGECRLKDSFKIVQGSLHRCLRGLDILNVPSHFQAINLAKRHQHIYR